MANKSNFTPNGRYGYGGATVDYGSRLGWWDRTLFPKSHTDITIKITNKYSQRPDAVAYDVYGQSSLMWFVLQYNNIMDVSTEFIEGKSIILPSKSRLFTEILTKRQKPISKT